MQLELPVIDIGPWVHRGGNVADAEQRLATSAALHKACVEFGFFYLDLRDSSEGERLSDEAEACLELAKTSHSA